MNIQTSVADADVAKHEAEIKARAAEFEVRFQMEAADFLQSRLPQLAALLNLMSDLDHESSFKMLPDDQQGEVLQLSWTLARDCNQAAELL